MGASALGSSIPALLEARKSDSVSLSLSETHPKCRRCQIAVLGLLLAGPVVMSLLRLQPLRPGFHFHWQRQGSTRNSWGEGAHERGHFVKQLGIGLCAFIYFPAMEEVGEKERGGERERKKLKKVERVYLIWGEFCTGLYIKAARN